MKRLELPNKYQIPDITKYELDILSDIYNIQITNVNELSGGIMNKLYSFNNSIVIKKINPIYNSNNIIENINNQFLLSKITSSVAEVLQTKDRKNIFKISDYYFYATKMYIGTSPSVRDVDKVIDNLQIFHKYFHKSLKQINISSNIYDDLVLALKYLKTFGKFYQIKIAALENLVNTIMDEIRKKNWISKSSWIHGDPTVKNIIKSDGKLIFIDFDRAGMKSEIEDWGRLLCSLGLIDISNEIFEKSIFASSYNVKLINSSLNTIKNYLFEKKIYNWLILYCQYFTVRRGIWEIIQDKSPITQLNFDYYTGNVKEKINQLKTIYDQ